MKEKFDAVIVGGGLAGLSLAIGLRDRSHSVAVLEARAGIKPVKRGLSISPNGLEALDKLHLLQDIEKIGVKVQFVKYFKGNGELLVAYDYSLLERKQNYLLALLPHELELYLRKYALEKGVKLLEGASFGGLLQENGRRKGVRASVGGSALDIEADVIVGADGTASKVRETVGIRTLTKKYDHSYIVTVAGPLKNQAEDARHYLAKGKMLGVFPLPTGTYLFYYVPTGTFEALKTLGLEPFKTQLVTLAPELAEPLAEVNSWDDFLYMTPQLVRANSWVSDQVALLGDAVHSLEPSLGQGSSLTLQDVTALLLVLDRCFAESDFSAKALKVYEEYRRPHTEFIQAMAERTAMLMNTSSRVVEWLRDISLRNIQKKQASMLLGLEMASGMVQDLGAVEKLRLAGVL